jgi:hypothetical protein
MWEVHPESSTKSAPLALAEECSLLKAILALSQEKENSSEKFEVELFELCPLLEFPRLKLPPFKFPPLPFFLKQWSSV